MRVPRGLPRENVVASNLERGRDRSAQNRVFTQRRHGDPGPERKQLSQLTFDRLHEQVAVPADAAAKDHELRVQHRRDRGDGEAEQGRLALDDTPRSPIAAPGCDEDPLGRQR